MNLLIWVLASADKRASVAPTRTCPDPVGRSACADVAASLPRHGGVKPPLRHADLKVSATTQAASPAKPFTQEQVVSMVRDGFGDESGAKLIEQRNRFRPDRVIVNGNERARARQRS